MHDLELLGFGGTARPMRSLNLAGRDGFLSPLAIATSNGMEPIKTPDFTAPDMAAPALRPGNLATCGVDYIPEASALTAADPGGRAPLPNAVHPITGTATLMSEPTTAHDVATNSDIAASLYPGLGFPGLSVNHDPTTSDVAMPDMQNPQTMPERSMSSRPGDLDPGALSALHASPQYRAVQGREYPEVYMDNRGDNSRRSREHTLLMAGLDAQPGRKSLRGTPGGY